MPPAPLAGVLFDKDGVLVDFAATWDPAGGEVIAALAEGDEALEAALAGAVLYDRKARRFDPASLFIAGSSGELMAVWRPLLPDRPGLAREVAALFTRTGVENVAPVADAPEALAALARAGVPLGVATNDAEASARAQVQRLGIAGRFAFVAGADSGHGAKPGGGMVRAFAAHLDVEPGRVALVGDTLHDVHAAKDAGAISIGVGTGPGGLEPLRGAADHLIGTLAELPALVADLRG